jgi:hypothetical protein
MTAIPYPQLKINFNPPIRGLSHTRARIRG